MAQTMEALLSEYDCGVDFDADADADRAKIFDDCGVNFRDFDTELRRAKVSEDDKLVEYDALLLDQFDIPQDVHKEEIRETMIEAQGSEDEELISILDFDADSVPVPDADRAKIVDVDDWGVYIARAFGIEVVKMNKACDYHTMACMFAGNWGSLGTVQSRNRIQFEPRHVYIGNRYNGNMATTCLVHRAIGRPVSTEMSNIWKDNSQAEHSGTLMMLAENEGWPHLGNVQSEYRDGSTELQFRRRYNGNHHYINMNNLQRTAAGREVFIEELSSLPRAPSNNRKDSGQDEGFGTWTFAGSSLVAGTIFTSILGVSDGQTSEDIKLWDITGIPDDYYKLAFMTLCFLASIIWMIGGIWSRRGAFIFKVLFLLLIVGPFLLSYFFVLKDKVPKFHVFYGSQRISSFRFLSLFHVYVLLIGSIGWYISKTVHDRYSKQESYGTPGLPV